MTFKLGLTGSIGMGKSTTAQLFADQGCAVWDADNAVHRLYAKDGAAVAPLQEMVPSAIVDGAVSRSKLRRLITNDPTLLARIERAVHPLLADDRRTFLETTETDIAVFDIPLLFETGGDAAMDAVVCVSATEQEQQSRVLARGTMSLEEFRQIRDRQMPNSEKMARSDFVVYTDTLEHACEQVHDIVQKIRARLSDA